MKRLGQVFIGITTILLVLTAGSATWLYYTDLGQYKTQIEELISKQTGRDFAIGGDLQLKLLPQPHLLAEEVSLANAEWGSAPTLAQIGLLAVDVDLISIVKQPIIVHDFRLIDVDILLEQNAEGLANTSMGSAPSEDTSRGKSSGSSGDSGLPLLIEHAELRNVTLTQRQPGSEDQVTRIDSLIIAANDSDQLALSGTGEIMQRPLAIEGFIGPIDQVQALGDVALDLNGSWGLVALDINGRVAELQGLKGVAIDATLSVDDVADIIQALELPVKHSGPLTADVRYEKTRRYRQPICCSQIRTHCGNSTSRTRAKPRQCRCHTR